MSWVPRKHFRQHHVNNHERVRPCETNQVSETRLRLPSIGSMVQHGSQRCDNIERRFGSENTGDMSLIEHVHLTETVLEWRMAARSLPEKLLKHFGHMD